ncbi:MAG: mannitol dehydrogenase family protein, partial [Lachnospiraceae bacterium]|nr:mannitol dehydrogenase family protein [Lachnospiraceae bacterium]
SQKVPIRFGETILSYASSDSLDVKSLTFIPLAIAGWMRYLLGVDDEGLPFECSPDPMLDELQGMLKGVSLGDPASATDERLAPVLSNRTLFANDLCEIGIAPKICGMLREMLTGPGAVKAVLKKYV